MLYIIILGMNRQYEQIFRAKTLNHHQLKSKVLSQFPNYDHKKKYNYDQLLYILDQQINQRCDRDVLQEIFSQAENSSSQASIDDVVAKYIQNLETSKVFILRDQYKIKQLTQKLQSIKNRNKSFIFLKMIQASIYTRFTKEPTFQYRIQPTQLPPVTLVNALNPIINHQYTLQMEQDTFDVVFFQSGIEILRWSFPDRVDLEEGEYSRTVKSQNVTFEVKIKYMPKDQNKARQRVKQELNEVQSHLQSEKQAFHRLCIFKPFLQKREGPVSSAPVDKGAWYNFTDVVFDYFPFLKQHVKTLFYALILTILVECWASSFWPIEFLDIITCFYTLSLLLDESIRDYSMRLLILQLSFLILSIKSIWGASEQPFFAQSQSNKVIIVICIILKVFLIFALAVTLIRKDEIDNLKAELLPPNQAAIKKAQQDKKVSQSLYDD